MGNAFGCMLKKDLGCNVRSSSKRSSKSRSQRKMVASEEELLHCQALAMAIQQHQLLQQFEGSMSHRIGSTSSRRRDLPDSLNNGKQVILVGHSCGGASISYALECYPKKISKAVFLSATMVLDGQKPFDVFSGELASVDVFLKESQLLVYGNGRGKPPTGLMLDKQQMKDIALAAASMRPIPLAPIMEKLSLTPKNYGTVQQFFIQTLDDHMISPDVQEKLVRENPPHGIYKIKGSDHCPFFSKPQSLHKIFLEIVQLPQQN